nr:MAG TPA: hypothetical protein [Caudoviricetes sp.]
MRAHIGSAECIPSRYHHAAMFRINFYVDRINRKLSKNNLGK